MNSYIFTTGVLITGVPAVYWLALALLVFPVAYNNGAVILSLCTGMIMMIACADGEGRIIKANKKTAPTGRQGRLT